MHEVTFSSIIGGRMKSWIVGWRVFGRRSHGEGPESIQFLQEKPILRTESKGNERVGRPIGQENSNQKQLNWRTSILLLLGGINNGFKEDLEANPKRERRDKTVATDKEAMDFDWFCLPFSEITPGYAKHVNMLWRRN